MRPWRNFSPLRIRDMLHGPGRSYWMLELFQSWKIHFSTINEIRLPSLPFHSPSTRICPSPRSSQTPAFKTPPTKFTLQPCRRSHLTKVHLLPTPVQTAKTSPSRVKQLNFNVNLHLLLMLRSSAMSSLHPQAKPFSFSANNSERKTNEKAFTMRLKQPYKPSLQLLKMSAKLSTKSMELQPPTKMKRKSISRIYKKFWYDLRIWNWNVRFQKPTALSWGLHSIWSTLVWTSLWSVMFLMTNLRIWSNSHKRFQTSAEGRGLGNVTLWCVR
jgi:hypothetical protein